MKKIPSMARQIIATAPTMSLTNTSAFVGLSFSPSDLVFVAVVGWFVSVESSLYVSSAEASFDTAARRGRERTRVGKVAFIWLEVVCYTLCIAVIRDDAHLQS